MHIKKEGKRGKKLNKLKNKIKKVIIKENTYEITQKWDPYFWKGAVTNSDPELMSCHVKLKCLLISWIMNLLFKPISFTDVIVVFVYGQITDDKRQNTEYIRQTDDRYKIFIAVSESKGSKTCKKKFGTTGRKSIVEISIMHVLRSFGHIKMYKHRNKMFIFL